MSRYSYSKYLSRYTHPRQRYKAFRKLGKSVWSNFYQSLRRIK